MRIFFKVATGVLYAGMDESNHGEKVKSRIGEIVVTACSFDSAYWKPRKHPNRADKSSLEPWNWEGVDFLYTVLPNDIAASRYSNLPLVAPKLLVPFMQERRIYVGRLALDGKLQREDEAKLSDQFADNQITMIITKYPKKNHVHYGPQLIYLAHLFAGHLFREVSLLEMSEDERYTPFRLLNI